MEKELSFLDLPGGRSEGTIVLKLNDIVRKVVKARLAELEDTIVSFAVESLRDAIREEDILNIRDQSGPQPFGGIMEFTPWDGPTMTQLSTLKELSISDSIVIPEGKSESVAVPITIDGTEYYVMLHKDYRIVYDKIPLIDGGHDIGEDIVGVLDSNDALWKAVRSVQDGTIQSYIHETDGHLHKIGTHMVMIDGCNMIMPVWEQK